MSRHPGGGAVRGEEQRKKNGENRDGPNSILLPTLSKHRECFSTARLQMPIYSNHIPRIFHTNLLEFDGKTGVL